MVRKNNEVESNTAKGKGLFNLGEHRKAWLRSVSESAGCFDNDVICMLIDQSSVEDPENFAVRMKKFKAAAKIKDLEQREKAIQDEKAQLVRELEGERQEGLSHAGR